MLFHFMHTPQLNGYIIDRLNIDVDPNQQWELKTSIEMDFVEVEELLTLVRSLFSTAFSKYSSIGTPESVDVEVVRKVQSGTWQPPRIFSLKLDQREWEFLSKEIPGFPFRYKLENLGRLLQTIQPPNRK